MDEGQTFTKDGNIHRSAASFFLELLNLDIEELGEPFLDCLEQIPSDMDVRYICAEPTDDEIRAAVFGISGDSVSRPNGYFGFFSRLLGDC